MVIEKEKVRGYKDLLVWQKGIQLAKEIYRLTQTFPNEEKFGFVSQMRRAAVSIPTLRRDRPATRGTSSCSLYPTRKAQWRSWTLS